MSAKGKTVVTAILASLLALSSCGGGEQVRADDEETQASTAARASAERTIGQTASERTASEPATGQEGGAIARAGDNVVARAGDGAVARAGDAEARANSGEEAVGKNARDARKVTLEVGGDDGTRFSLACVPSAGKRRISAGVSQRATTTTRVVTNSSARSIRKGVAPSRSSWLPGATCAPCNGPTPRKAQ